LKQRQTEADGKNNMGKSDRSGEERMDRLTADGRGRRAKGQYCAGSPRCFPTSDAWWMEEAVNEWIKN